MVRSVAGGSGRRDEREKSSEMIVVWFVKKKRFVCRPSGTTRLVEELEANLKSWMV